MNNKYAIFYKTDKNSYWHSKRIDLPIEQWEEYCKEQGYAQYEIKDLSTYSADDLHLLTDVVHFNGRYYLPEEKIEYPDNKPTEICKFDFSMKWEDEDEFYDIDYDEVYSGEKLWTNIITNFSINKKMDELGIAAQIFVEDFPKFLEKLRKNNNAVYNNEEYSPFKWLAWIKENKVRLIHQTYQEENPITEFDVLVDKAWYFSFCEDMIKTMKDYADKDLKRYNEYIKEKYGEN